jgi:DNA-binding LacI/PurR family transcriptional regulator
MSVAIKSRRKTIALVVDILAGTGSYQEDIWRSAAAACRQAGAGLLIFPGGALGGTPFVKYEYMKNVIYGLIRRECVDGVILAIGNIVSLASRAHYADFARGFGGIPTVNVGFALDGVPGVVVSNENAMERVLEHLVTDHGYKKVAFIRGPEQHEDAVGRFLAYRTVLERHGLPFRPEYTFIGDFSESSGARAVGAWLDERKIDFDCVAASGDYMAIGAVKELLARGKRIPQDIAVTGFDDIYEAGVISPGLTTIRQPLPAQMRKAVEVLIDLMEGKPRENKAYPIDLEIMKRRSCGCAASGSGAAFVLPPWSGGDRAPWLAEVSRTLAAGFREQTPAGNSHGDLEKEMLALFTAYADEMEGKRGDVFLSAWEKFFHAHFRQTAELGLVMETMIAFRNTALQLTGTDRGPAERADRLLTQAHNALMEIVFRLEAGKRAQVENLANQLSRASVLLGGAFDIPLLQQTLQEVMPGLGVRHYLLGLYADPARPLAGLKIAARVRAGEAVAISGNDTIITWQALAGEKDFLDAGGLAAVCPLFYQEEQIGLLYMELPTEYGFMYETIVSQLGLAVHGARLVEKNVRTRTVIEDHSRRIRELSQPIMESIREISGIAAEKMESAHVLVGQTNRSRDKIGETNKNIETISNYTGTLFDIIKTIDEVAERVNLLALNAAIEATHVGKEGGGFSVIAKEIKKLAETTSRHSDEIAATLRKIVDSAGKSSRNGQESLEAFREQARGVTDILDSFRAISEKMRTLGEGSETILELFREE